MREANESHPDANCGCIALFSGMSCGHCWCTGAEPKVCVCVRVCQDHWGKDCFQVVERGASHGLFLLRCGIQRQTTGQRAAKNPAGFPSAALWNRA